MNGLWRAVPADADEGEGGRGAARWERSPVLPPGPSPPGCASQFLRFWLRASCVRVQPEAGAGQGLVHRHLPAERSCRWRWEEVQVAQGVGPPRSPEASRLQGVSDGGAVS